MALFAIQAKEGKQDKPEEEPIEVKEEKVYTKDEIIIELKKLKKAMKMDTTSFSYTLFSQIVTFFLVMAAWIFFRASSVKMGILMIKNMFTVWNPYIFWTDDIYMLGLDGRNFRLLILSIFLLRHTTEIIHIQILIL